MKHRKSTTLGSTVRHRPHRLRRSSTIFAACLLFAVLATAGLSLLTRNPQQSGVGNSQASAQEPADINNDNVVDVYDLTTLLGKWNTTDTTADISKDGIVNVFDLSILLSKWGVVSVGSGQKCNGLTNLEFCDDFDGTAGTMPDSTKWRILGGSSWGGQCFKNLPENISMDGQGNLKMTLINKGTFQCTDSDGYPSNISSGGMDTMNKKYFKYGRFEIRAKLACAKSVWGAFWTATGTGPAWPQSGEIDIYEMFRNDNRIKNSIHVGNPHWHTGKYYTQTEPFCNDFHVYGMIWSPGSIKYTFNGEVKNEFTPADVGTNPWPFDTYDQRLIIDLQYGGPGRPNAGEYDVNELPSSMLIDYVRVYKN